MQIIVFMRKPIVWPWIAGPALGALVGISLYPLIGLKGPVLFVVAGAVIGLIMGAAWVVWRLRGPADLVLEQVTISIPKFSQFKFVVNAEYRKTAWVLFIETMTRVSTQPLAADAGSLAVAVESLHGLFGTTRELLKESAPSHPKEGATVEMLALQMLNAEIRPFLARWHPDLDLYMLHHKGEGGWPGAVECRAKLDSLRQTLQEYARAYGELAGVQQLDRFFQIGAPNG